MRCRDCGIRSVTPPDSLCWYCQGERRLTVAQRAYRMAVKRLGFIRFPHCDSLVLHARGSCRYCSKREYDGLHELRARYSIAYTGSLPETGQEPCPAEAFRPVDVIERWPGNSAELA